MTGMDFALVRRSSGRYDFQAIGGDLAKTDDCGPSILRLLIQGAPWAGDDGERDGLSLQDVRFVTTGTRAIVQGIIENRLSSLLSSGKLSSVAVLDVRTEEDRIYASVSVTRPGQTPETIQVPLGR
jgi:hypothetical protein